MYLRFEFPGAEVVDDEGDAFAADLAEHAVAEREVAERHGLR